MRLSVGYAALAIAICSSLPANLAAQPSSLDGPPRRPLPAGINPQDTILPGQRQSAPIFGQQPTGPRGGSAAPNANKAQKPPNAATPGDLKGVAPGASAPAGAAPNAVNNPLPATAIPQGGGRYPIAPPAPRANPYDNYSTQANPAMAAPAGGYAPGTIPAPPTPAPAQGSMQAPASLTPMPAGSGVSLGFDPTLGPSNGHFDAAMRNPAGLYPPPPGAAGGCNDCLTGPSCCPAPCCCDPYWFGTFGALVMGRNQPNRSWLSAQKSDYFNQVMNGADAAAPWAGGWEASVGRYFPGFGAISFTYWGLAPTTGFDSVRMPGDLVTPINLNDVNIGNVGADFFYDNAQEHRVQRKDEINNLELNFLGLPALTSGHFNLFWLAGVRYFRFRDQLVFSAVHEGFEFGSDGGVNEADLDVALANNLIGPQIGAFANWSITERWGFFLFPRIGVFANQMTQHFQLYRGDGLSAINESSSKTVGSILGQIDIGFNYWITPNWSLYFGYRVMGVSGVGLADAQIPAFLIDTPEIRAIDSNGNLILQGGTAGMLWRY